MTIKRRITIIKAYEDLKKRYENGDKDVVKTEMGYKLVKPTGETIMEIGF